MFGISLSSNHEHFVFDGTSLRGRKYLESWERGTSFKVISDDIAILCSKMMKEGVHS